MKDATIHLDDKYILKSQFRCNCSDEYIAWLDLLAWRGFTAPKAILGKKGVDGVKLKQVSNWLGN